LADTRVLVTGGAGFIGSHIADALIAAGYDVLVLDDLSTGRRENVPAQAKFVHGDIRDSETINRLMSEFQPQVVTHQAAQTSVAVSTREPVRDASINILGSLEILQACVKHRVGRLVFASTGGAIYGEVPDGQRASIDWTPAPLSPYACAKFALEKYLHAYEKEHGLKASVLRYANVYGPRQDPHGEAGVVAIFARRILAGEPIQINARRELGDAGCVRDYVHVADVVRANLLAIAGQLPVPLLNVCTGEATTTLEIAQLLQQAAGDDVQSRKSAIGFAPRRPGDLQRSVLDPEVPGQAQLQPQLRELLGAPVPLRTGLAQTLAWFRERERR